MNPKSGEGQKRGFYVLNLNLLKNEPKADKGEIYFYNFIEK
jgi:hypothetical protein